MVKNIIHFIIEYVIMQLCNYIYILSSIDMHYSMSSQSVQIAPSSPRPEATEPCPPDAL